MIVMALPTGDAEAKNWIESGRLGRPRDEKMPLRKVSGIAFELKGKDCLLVYRLVQDIFFCCVPRGVG
jgi:hypothetical protein